MSNNMREALQAACDALEEIALAGMSGTGQESEDGMRAWHARRAWEFIGIAARALDPIRDALDAAPAPVAQPAGEPVAQQDEANWTEVDLWAEIHRLRAEVAGPDGFATWKEAAVAERVRRVRAESAAELFRFYEQSHRARGPEHLTKAERNAEIAGRIEAALAAAATVAQPVAWMHESGIMRLEADMQPICKGLDSWRPLVFGDPDNTAAASPKLKTGGWWALTGSRLVVESVHPAGGTTHRELSDAERKAWAAFIEATGQEGGTA